MKKFSKTTFLAAALMVGGHAVAQVTLYERGDFQGRSFTTNESIKNLKREGFNDRSSSISVRGNKSERWEVCEDRRFQGQCVVLRRGDYPSLAAMGLNDRVSSVRVVARNERVEDNRYAPLPRQAGDSQAVFYEDDDFEGRSLSVDESLGDFRRSRFNDLISSAVITGERWEVCQNTEYKGRCVVLRPGKYDSADAMGLKNDSISSARAISNSARVNEDRYAPLPASGDVNEVVFYEKEGFRGRSFTTDESVDDLRGTGLNNRASSAVVRGERWEVCTQDDYDGRCTVLRPGQYGSLDAMGMNDRVSSVRSVKRSARINDNRYAPRPIADYDYGRRSNEKIYQANITHVRAVVEDQGERCWVEREEANQGTSANNVPGAIIGAVLGGVLGHQVGGGSGKDVATGVGAIAGAVLGANSGKWIGGQKDASQDVRRCSTSPDQAHPAYWDVTYVFRGVEHQLQMMTPPGASVPVNEKGEPRF